MELVNIRETKPNRPAQEFIANQYGITRKKINEFKSLLKKEIGENEIHQFLIENPSFFISLLRNFRTGHHNTWVFTKQQIRTHIKGLQRGLIPDFLVVGKNSDGYSCYIIELKKPTQNLFSVNSKNEISMSSELNKALCQLFEYMRHTSDYKDEVRKLFNVENFRDPEGILIIGREIEMNNKLKSDLKYSMNNAMERTIKINTYDSILNHLDSILDHLPKEKKLLNKLKQLGKK